MYGYEMKFAPVAPIHLLKDMWDRETASGKECLGSYHLLLAHDVMESTDKLTQYGELFSKVVDYYGAGGSDGANIIMDNSVIELGEAVTMDWVIEAAKYACANIVVIPDELGDWEKTVSKFRQAADALHSSTLESFEFMFVPQGRNLHEFVRCVELVLESHPRVASWIGIPRLARQMYGISRVDLIEAIDCIVRSSQNTDARSSNERKAIKYHLLGFSNDVLDDIAAARITFAEGIDSAVPIRAGQKGFKFYASESEYGKRGDYWTKSASLTDLAVSNMEYYRRLIRS